MKINKEVICIRSEPEDSVKKGSPYIVLSTITCKCGAVGFDVGVKFPFGYDIVVCDCGEIFDDGIPWVDSDKFAPIVEDEFLNSDEIDKIVEERIDTKIPIEA